MSESQTRQDADRPTAVVAEDEALIARAFVAELATVWPELDVVSVAPHGRAACESLLTHQPDIVFLDIRMPVMSGIEVAEALVEDWRGSRPPPLVVFVTAFDQFAVDAFTHAAVDYLLKPVDPVRLGLTVDRLRQRLAERRAATASGLSTEIPLEALAAQLQQLAARLPRGSGLSTVAASAGIAPSGPLRFIRAGFGDSVRLLPVDEVRFFQAVDKYVRVVTAGSEALIRESLRELGARLDPTRFVQIHRSIIVNLDHVRSATRDDPARRMLLEVDGCDERLTVSRLYAHLFKAM